MKPIALLRICLVTLMLFAVGNRAAHAEDIVSQWNWMMQQTVASSDPFIQSRTAAITQLAVFEAVNSVTKEYKKYAGGFLSPEDSNLDAAVIEAAFRTLITLHPANASTLESARATGLAAIPSSLQKDEGIAVGNVAALNMLARRANDGWNVNVPYTQGTDPGQWQPTPPDFLPPVHVGWGNVTPFGIVDVIDYRPEPPPDLDSFRYAKAYNEVKKFGENDSSLRLPFLTNLAHFYRISPTQIYNPAVRQVIGQRQDSLTTNARTFALVNMAIADALIASMDSKYYYDFWRPVTAIQLGDTDDNDKTTADTSWLPLAVTPPTPSYPSTHSSAGAAARAILGKLYGGNGHSIVLTSPTLQGIAIRYRSWEQIGADDDDAQIFGGIHFSFDQEAGAWQGSKIGRYILRTLLRPSPPEEPLGSGQNFRRIIE